MGGQSTRDGRGGAGAGSETPHPHEGWITGWGRGCAFAILRKVAAAGLSSASCTCCLLMVSAQCRETND